MVRATSSPSIFALQVTEKEEFEPELVYTEPLIFGQSRGRTPEVGIGVAPTRLVPLLDEGVEPEDLVARGREVTAGVVLDAKLDEPVADMDDNDDVVAGLFDVEPIVLEDREEELRIFVSDPED